ncbi:LuxR C-terminal-related transcriptional regulator [Aeromicrobium sp. CTD01-1L150]|uniref:LuxR C-terminal-related transcriptional regulator n=1 Tax=Aeromicrobium sp. CTD01-1L150 TaxID=3341830 RepID=UPI0035C0B3FF
MRAIVAEDNALLRDGLIRLLQAHEIAVVHAVDSVDGLVGAVGAVPDVDVVITDIRMPPTFTTEGLQAAIDLRRGRPDLPVLVLSQFVEQVYARELMSTGHGSVGYLLKDRVTRVSEFIDDVRRVSAGATVLDPQVVSALVSSRDDGGPLDRLTPREREVLELMAQGRSNAAIAQALVVTEKAVGKHVSNVFMKLDLSHHGDDNRRVLAVLRFLQSR